MKERPILMSAPIVRALLAGTKTQTRRVVNPQPTHFNPVGVPRRVVPDGGPSAVIACPYGQPGDRLWVRETWMDMQGTGVEHRDRAGMRQRYAYAADTPPGSYGDECRKDLGLKWRPSIHMPRAASRITLEVTGARVERLHDITEADALAEGVTPKWQPGCIGRLMDAFGGFSFRPAASAYAELWEQIKGGGSWDQNPWVWVIEFKRVDSAEKGIAP